MSTTNPQYSSLQKSATKIINILLATHLHGNCNTEPHQPASNIDIAVSQHPSKQRQRILILQAKMRQSRTKNQKTDGIGGNKVAATLLKTNGRISAPSETARRNSKNTAHKYQPEQRKIAVKAVDIFGNDTMKILEVTT